MTSALHRMVAHACENNALYRGKMDERGVSVHEITTISDLARLPFTTREELSSDPWVLLCVPRSSLVLTHMSTGTTGKRPVYISYDWEDLYTRGLMPLTNAARTTKLLKIEPGEIVFNALPYEISVTGLAIHRSVQDGIGACVVPVGKGGFYSEPGKTLKLMREIQGDHLFTAPSYAVHLAELAGTDNRNLRDIYGLRSIWLIGELCSDALRRRIERMWGCPAFMYYGSMESGPIGVECSEQDGFHVATNFSAVEIIDLDEPIKTLDGTPLGEVVVTTLWRYASPVIRYRTGDLAFWDTRPCKCGLPGPRLRLHGRKEDVLRLKSTCLHTIDIEQGLLSMPDISSWFQFKQYAGKLIVMLPETQGVPFERAGVTAALWINDRLGVSCAVEPVPAVSYSGGKFIRAVVPTKETRDDS